MTQYLCRDPCWGGKILTEKNKEFLQNMPASTHRKSDDRSARTNNTIPQKWGFAYSKI